MMSISCIRVERSSFRRPAMVLFLQFSTKSASFSCVNSKVIIDSGALNDLALVSAYVGVVNAYNYKSIRFPARIVFLFM